MTKKDILLIHGLGDSTAVWEPLAHHLSPHFSVHTLALPGHGANDSITDTASAIESFINHYDALNLERPLVVGHSAGALLGVILSSVREFSGVVLLDQPLILAGDIDTEKLFKTVDKKDVQASLQTIFVGLGSDRISNTGYQGLSIQHITYETLSTFWGGPAAAFMASVQHIISSAKTRVLSLEWIQYDADGAAQISEMAPTLIREKLEGATHHWAHIDHPDLIAKRLLTFSGTLATPK